MEGIDIMQRRGMRLRDSGELTNILGQVIDLSSGKFGKASYSCDFTRKKNEALSTAFELEFTL